MRTLFDTSFFHAFSKTSRVWQVDSAIRFSHSPIKDVALTFHFPQYCDWRIATPYLGASPSGKAISVTMRLRCVCSGVSLGPVEINPNEAQSLSMLDQHAPGKMSPRWLDNLIKIDMNLKRSPTMKGRQQFFWVSRDPHEQGLLRLTRFWTWSIARILRYASFCTSVSGQKTTSSVFWGSWCLIMSFVLSLNEWDDNKPRQSCLPSEEEVGEQPVSEDECDNLTHFRSTGTHSDELTHHNSPVHSPFPPLSRSQIDLLLTVWQWTRSTAWTCREPQGLSNLR